MNKPVVSVSTLIRRILKDVKEQFYGDIPEQLYKILWNCFKWIYTIGYENGYKAATTVNKCRPVEQMKDGEVINTFRSITEAAESVNRTKGHMWRAIVGKEGRKTCGGYKWRYKNY